LKTKQYDIPSIVLFILGIIDIVRGFLHTFEVNWAAQTFAKLNLNFVRADQLTLLGAFGISNILTGFLYILISKKAIIPISYIIGFVGLKMSGIYSSAAFEGKYFMIIYLLVCVITSGIFFIQKRKRKGF
jgi:hypothetical protein